MNQHGVNPVTASLPPSGSQSLLVRAIGCFTKTFGSVYRGRSLIFSVGHRLIRQSLSSTSTMRDQRAVVRPLPQLGQMLNIANLIFNSQ